jgi:hypothetical protein
MVPASPLSNAGGVKCACDHARIERAARGRRHAHASSGAPRWRGRPRSGWARCWSCRFSRCSEESAPVAEGEVIALTRGVPGRLIQFSLLWEAAVPFRGGSATWPQAFNAACAASGDQRGSSSERNHVSSRSSVPSPAIPQGRTPHPPRRQMYGFRYFQYLIHPGLSSRIRSWRARPYESIAVKVTLIVVLTCAPVSIGDADGGCAGAGDTGSRLPSDDATRAPAQWIR